jgi:D-lactate dehydrogenase (cytochrome)
MDIDPVTPDDALLEALSGLLGDRFVVSEAIRAQHGVGESFHAGAPPDAVVFPHTTDEVSRIVRLCSTHRTPIIPYGAGTSLEGHVHAVRGGICIAMGQMNRLIELNQDDMDCRVDAGLTRRGLEAHLKGSGLFFPVDPGADATLGGMVGTGASGTTTVRYGTMRENVLGLTVVLADGRVIRTGTRARKSSAGYDLTRLFIGSEGTLGVVTEVSLRLHGLAEAVAAAVCSFETLEGAAAAVTTCIQSGIPLARSELLDDVQMDAVNRFSGFDYAVQPTVFFEFHGTPAAVREQTDAVAEIVAEFGGADFRWATLLEDRNALWHARHEAYYAALALRPGCRGWATDVCVPVSRLADAIAQARSDIDAEGLVAPIVGHVGDGNFHVLFLLDPGDEDQMAAAARVNTRMIERAIDAGGTCTGEHGVGFGKMKYLRKEHGDALDAMRLVKQALDPSGLMNPGKVVE